MSHVVYHWFAEPSDNRQIGKILRCPLIVSIATLRAVDPDIDIVVLNTTYDKLSQDWKPYRKALDFDVWGIDEYLKKGYQDKAGHRHLSRLFDIRRFEWGHGDTILYSDADVFWLQPPFPTAMNANRFCFDGYNTGLFYFNHESGLVKQFFELFEAYTIGALNNEHIRRLMKTYVGYDAWYYVWDEMIMTYMFKEHKELFWQIPKEEHCCSRDLKYVTKDIKAFHCNGTMVKNLVTEDKHARGLMGILVKEWWDAINKVIDPKLIFSDEEIDRHLPLQFSIAEPQRITNTLADDGHFYVT